MPHITAEYSANIEDALDVQGLLQALHDAVIDSGIDAIKIKTRALKLDNYIVGEAGENDSMIHVDFLLLEGRPDEVNKAIASDLFTTLQDYARDKGLKDCSATLELRIMAKDQYFK